MAFEPRSTYRLSSTPVYVISIADDGLRALCTAASDASGFGGIQQILFDVEPVEVRANIESGGEIAAPCFIPGGIVASNERGLVICGLDGRITRTIEVDTPIYISDWRCSSKAGLVVAEVYREVIAWKLDEGTQVCRRAAPCARAVGISELHGHVLGAFGAGHSPTELWRIDGDQLQLGLVENEPPAPQSVELSPHGRFLVSFRSSLAGEEGVRRPLALWSVAPFKLVAELDYHGRFNALTFSADESLVAHGGLDPIGQGGGFGSTVSLFETTTGQLLDRLCDSDSNAKAVRFLPNGKHLAIAYEDGGISIFDLSTRQVAYRLSCPLGEPTSIDFSADGRRMITGHSSGDIQLWSVT